MKELVRRRDRRRTREQLAEEAVGCTAFVERLARDRWMQAYALGAQHALEWALGERDTMNPLRAISLLEHVFDHDDEKVRPLRTKPFRTYPRIVWQRRPRLKAVKS